MTLDTPKPTPAPTVAVKRAPMRPTGTPFPANAKRGDVPQMGVVGGVPHAEKTAGTPGGKAIGPARPPRTPKPPYPAQARMAKLQGSGVCHVTFDASGHVSSASMSQSIGTRILDDATTGYAKLNWTGTPNTSTNVPITYEKP